MDRKRFEKLVEEALSDIPPSFRDLLDNIAVIVEAKPPRGKNLLGLYHGVPLRYRGSSYGNVPPDVIIIYQEPIESQCRTDEEVRDQVRETVLHEVGHYFGLDERRLRDNAWSRERPPTKGDRT
jgi:predicted Zn-dependent protease with MMP-like domain